MSTSLVMILVLICCSFLFNGALGLSANYNLYSDTGCANAISGASGSGLALPNSATSGSVTYATGCAAISGVSGAGSILIECATASSGGQSATAFAVLEYTDGACVTINGLATSGLSGSCAAFTSGSAKVTCNSAFGLYSVSLPLLLLLAILAILSM